LDVRCIDISTIFHRRVPAHTLLDSIGPLVQTTEESGRASGLAGWSSLGHHTVYVQLSYARHLRLAGLLDRFGSSDRTDCAESGKSPTLSCSLSPLPRRDGCRISPQAFLLHFCVFFYPFSAIFSGAYLPDIIGPIREDRMSAARQHVPLIGHDHTLSRL